MRSSDIILDDFLKTLYTRDFEKDMMPAFTYMNDSEAELLTVIDDKEIADLVNEIKTRGDEQYYVKEIAEETKKWPWSKPEIVKSYQLYVRSGYEYQVLNLGRTKGHIMCYFYGILTGLNYQLGFKDIIKVVKDKGTKNAGEL